MKNRESIYIWLSASVSASFIVLALYTSLPALRFKTPDVESVIEIDFVQWNEPIHATKKSIERQKPTPVKFHPINKESPPTKKLTESPAEEIPAIAEQQIPPVKPSSKSLSELPAISPQADAKQPIKDEKDVSRDMPVPTPIYKLTSMPRFAHKVEPQYPISMRALGRESQVKLEVLIDTKGKVRKVTIVHSGGDVFDNAARSALLASAFIPGNIEGKPVAVLMRIPIAFRLN